ncbi:hypothetical protein EG329_007544 [Mollisiaceae sp. DMI_Dod_QoI]|nr:hypothetical protein EG329_007544 [Helotiales sp. DMI_Dod_QoI]
MTEFIGLVEAEAELWDDGANVVGSQCEDIFGVAEYVGTLHEINSNDSTVALENVTSFGTEGRKANPEDEIAPSDSVYEYIVFRGSDVKDLRVEEPPAAKENKPPQVPNDPAILGSGSRPTPQSQASQLPRQGPQGQQQAPGAPPYGQHPQHSQYPPYFYPPPGGFGRGGPPGPGGFPPMPFGAPPPGWFAPPNQGFPPAPFGPPSNYQQTYVPGQYAPQPPTQPPKPSPIGPGANKQATPPAGQANANQTNAANVPQANDKQAEPKSLAKPAAEMPAAAVISPPTPPNASKPTASEVQAAINQTSTSQAAPPAAPKAPAPTAPKNARVVTPAVPLQNVAVPKIPTFFRPANAPAETAAKPAAKPVDPATSLRDATQAATAAVAAAMAKLPPANQTNGSAVDNLTRKVNEMRVNDAARAPRNPGGAGFAPRGARGPRGGGRNATHKVEVPEADFDFASANAKFNKQDLVKEAIAGSPLGETSPAASPQEPEVPVTGYNKATSFFDNISSEAKERAEGGNTRPGGREWRGEEQKKNVETFGQGSVDNGYRGGYRGRGRGRGRGGYRGRGTYGGNGQPGQTRGSYRGRGDAQAAV